MKFTFALFSLATLASLSYAASFVDPENCQRPVNITGLDVKLTRGDFISNEKLCGSTLCVDAGEAVLLGAPSLVCQDRNLEQGVFKCNRVKAVGKTQSNAVGDVGYDFCSLPAHSRTVAQFQCPNKGVSVTVYTTKDGKSSFSVGKTNAAQLGAATYRSKATRGVSRESWQSRNVI